MLGDLKTYLLSRRNLVGQGVKEAEDVKAENLTQMAVDVANGLNFLHSLKYVHRFVCYFIVITFVSGHLKNAFKMFPVH